jgi:succinate dehydrogenase flavin-adding protein (antitoxin of CptAB toxin-antitoxin module)
MTATVKQICELRDAVIELTNQLKDLRERSEATKAGRYYGILEQRDRDIISMIVDAAAERKQYELNRVLAEVTVSVEGV